MVPHWRRREGFFVGSLRFSHRYFERQGEEEANLKLSCVVKLLSNVLSSLQVFDQTLMAMLPDEVRKIPGAYFCPILFLSNSSFPIFFTAAGAVGDKVQGGGKVRL